MFHKQDKNANRVIRHARVRKKVAGTSARPRLCVYRSLNNIYAQVIDDAARATICSASTLDKTVAAQVAEMTKKQAAKLVGETIAKRALDKGIKSVVFDRGGYIYTGRVQELAAGAREVGLEF